MPLFEEALRVDYQKRYPDDVKPEDKYYFGIYIRASDESRLYTREGYDLLSYLGDLGGLFDVLTVFGSTLTGFFSLKLFHAALIGSAYRIQSSLKDSVPSNVEPVSN